MPVRETDRFLLYSWHMNTATWSCIFWSGFGVSTHNLDLAAEVCIASTAVVLFSAEYANLAVEESRVKRLCILDEKIRLRNTRSLLRLPVWAVGEDKIHASVLCIDLLRWCCNSRCNGGPEESWYASYLWCNYFPERKRHWHQPVRLPCLAVS